MTIDTDLQLGACVDPGQTQKMSFSPSSKATRVLVANAEVPVVYDYVDFYYDSAGRVNIAEYIVEGNRAEYNIIFAADMSGDLQDTFFTISTEFNDQLFDVIYSVDEVTPATTVNTQIIINIVTDDSADTVALKTAATINAAQRSINVNTLGPIISFCNFFVGIITEPNLTSASTFSLSDFVNGTNGKVVAKKKHIYVDAMSDCLTRSFVVTYE